MEGFLFYISLSMFMCCIIFALLYVCVCVSGCAFANVRVGVCVCMGNIYTSAEIPKTQILKKHLLLFVKRFILCHIYIYMCVC